VIRVLVVDDSAAAREAISAILNRVPEIEVVGEAMDGVEGVQLTAQLKPDVITMDIKMPRMDGNEATRQIMATTPTPIVVVTGVTRQKVVHKGLDVLLAGALEIVQKPSALSTQGYETISEELVTKVKAVSGIAVQKPAHPVTQSPSHSHPVTQSPSQLVGQSLGPLDIPRVETKRRFHGRVQERMEGFDVGAAEFLTKPDKAKELVKRVESVLWAGDFPV